MLHAWHPETRGHKRKAAGTNRNAGILLKHQSFLRKQVLVAPLVLIIMELVCQPQRKQFQQSHPPNIKYASIRINQGSKSIDPILDQSGFNTSLYFNFNGCWWDCQPAGNADSHSQQPRCTEFSGTSSATVAFEFWHQKPPARLFHTSLVKKSKGKK